MGLPAVRSMAEMADGGECHRNAMFIRCIDDFLVTDRTAWLDDCFRTGFCRNVQTITEREESIRCHDRIFQGKPARLSWLQCGQSPHG